MHVFEKAGLGIAPFKFIGMHIDVGPHRYTDEFGVTTEVGSPGQPMGTCSYCGAGIKFVCRVQDSRGHVFDVGTTAEHCRAGKLRTIKHVLHLLGAE